MRMTARGSQGFGGNVGVAPPGGGSPCKQLSRLKARFPDQLGATGALLLEILREVLRRVENRIDSDIGEARFTKIRLVADGRDLVVQPRNDRPRGARRSDKGKIDRREIWKSELAQGRHIGKQSRARLRIDGKRFHRAAADVGNEVRQP